MGKLLLTTSCFLILILMGSSSSSSSTSSTVLAGGDHMMGWVPIRSSSSCKGSVGECLAGGGEDGEMEMEMEMEAEEFGMESEISRRILATSKYISYGALQRNNVPCSRRGASYYNCKPGAQANPYSRGCSRIARCRG